MEIPLGEFQIRSYTLADIPSLVNHANNPKVAATLRDRFPNPYTEADARSWIQQALQNEPETHFAIARGATVIGGVGLELQADVQSKSAQLGYWLGEPFWGKGIATGAVRALTHWAFTAFDLVRISALVFETNPASARVLEKAGFVREGRLRQSIYKNGRILDSYLYALLREEVAAGN